MQGTTDYYMRLTSFYSQFRAIGVNYNQVTEAIKNNFTEKKALAFLYQLEKATFELVASNKQIMDLIKEFEESYMQMKRGCNFISLQPLDFQVARGGLEPPAS